MPDLTKIATCSYCGTRSVLRLAGKVQHELACTNCGARLHEMKPLKRTPGAGRPTTVLSRNPAKRHAPAKTSRGRPRQRPLMGRIGWMLEEVFDEIEDIFD